MNTIEFSGKYYDQKVLLKELFDVGVMAVKPKEILNSFIKVLDSKVTIKTENKDINYNSVNKIFSICIGKA